MSINDFESVPEGVTSTNGKVISRYLQSKENLNYQVSESMNASYDFGYAMGVNDAAQRVIDWVKENISEFDFGDGVFINRDHFNSIMLIEFLETIKSERY